MKRANCYYGLGIIVLAVTLTMIVLNFKEEYVFPLLLEYALFIFVGLMLILIGELVKRLTIFENNLNNINKILFPDNAVSGLQVPERIRKAVSEESSASPKNHQ